jgi:cytochrome b
MAEQLTGKVRVWDLPTRLFHWAVAVAAVALLVTAKLGGGAMVWHGRLGYAVGTLLLFRIVWGFVGGHWSRFSAFPPSSKATLAYLRGAGAPLPGHSPLGALSVYALLAFLLAQVASGLFSDDTVEFSGPLGVRVSNATVKWLTWFHKNVGEPALIALVVLHITAVVYYIWCKRRNLITPMLQGDAAALAGVPSSRDDAWSRLLALLVLTACSLLMWGIVELGD